MPPTCAHCGTDVWPGYQVFGPAEDGTRETFCSEECRDAHYEEPPYQLAPVRFAPTPKVIGAPDPLPDDLADLDDPFAE